MKNQNVPETGNIDQQSNHDSEETENCSKKLSENWGEHPEQSTGVFDRPAVLFVAVVVFTLNRSF